MYLGTSRSSSKRPTLCVTQSSALRGVVATFKTFATVASQFCKTRLL